MTEGAEMKESLLCGADYCPRAVTKDDTNLQQLVAEFERLSKLDPDNHIFQSPAYYCFTKYSAVDIHGCNRILLKDLTEFPNEFHTRRFFLCRTITASIRIHSLLAVVESPDASEEYQGTLLSLGNYVSPVDEKIQACDSFLSPGTIILVKNPLYFKSPYDSFYTVKCDNPGDVLIIEEDTFSRQFPKIKWSSRVPQSEENALLIKPWWLWWWWPKPTKDWKRVAELRLEKRNYHGAMQAYEFALRSNPRDKEILTLRSALYLNLKVYRKSLEDSETILEIEEGNQKAIYNKALSFIGLGLYKFALQFLKTHIEKLRFSMDAEHEAELLKIESKAKTLSEQEERGEYDLVEIMGRPSNFTHEFANYTGNVRRQAIIGKGRGVVATADIQCGELLLAERAFAIVHSEDVKFKSALVHTPEKKELWRNNHLKLVSSIAHHLLFDPDMGKELYRLFDGNLRSVFEQTGSAEDNDIIDMKRIGAICHYNNFSRNTGNSTHGNDESYIGLWIFASYFNHSCYEANSSYFIAGDFMFIRASTNIRKNEEINISYVSPYMPYPERRSALSMYGFVCQCTLCQLDAKDSDLIHIRREELLTEISNLKPESDCRCLTVEKLIMKLTSLRLKDPKLNVCIHNPLMKLADYYEQVGDFKRAINIHHYVLNLSSGSNLIQTSYVSCYNALVCYLICEKTKKANNCFRAFKTILIQKYGTDSKDIIHCVSGDLLRLMTLCGIDH